MTEVAMYEARQPDPTGGRLVAWAASLGAAKQIGQALCATSFVPAAFKGKPEEAAAAILYGDEIGLTPTQSLQSVYVISGKPALYTRAMVAVVLAAGHEIETVEKSDATVTVRGRRRGSETWISETWTTARATKAGYTNNKKYATDPQSMLYARAAADVCRQVAPDALAGIGYSVEEMEYAEPATVTITREDRPAAPVAAPEGPVKVKRATTPKAAPEPVEPPLPEEEPATAAADDIVDAVIVSEPPDEPQPPKIPGGITAPQTKMMGALMRELGITGRDDALAYCADVIGRSIESRNDLTKDEAGRVLDALNADHNAQQAAGTMDAEVVA